MFSIVFVTLGALLDRSCQLAAVYKSTLARVAGVLVIVFGLHLTASYGLRRFNADKRLHNVKGGNTPWGAFVIGFAFAFGLDALCRADLSGILLIAAAQNSVCQGNPAPHCLLASAWQYHFC
jgi:cytochrome c-type biogenesis protein